MSVEFSDPADEMRFTVGETLIGINWGQAFEDTLIVRKEDAIVPFWSLLQWLVWVANCCPMRVVTVVDEAAGSITMGREWGLE